MIPAVIQPPEMFLRFFGTVGVVIGLIGSTIVIETAIAGPGSQGQVFHWNVTFEMRNESAPGSSGSADYRTTATALISLERRNMTRVEFTVSYQDQSVSPFTDPVVNVQITGPNGTGTATGRASTGGALFPIDVPNKVPPNATLDAPSEEKAIEAAAGSNATGEAGVGDWTVTLDVGAALARIVRGSISYTIEVQVYYFEGKAQKV